MRPHTGLSISLAVPLAAAWVGITAAKPLDWTALDPALEEASFVRDASVCASCHGDYIEAYAKTKHARTFQFGATPEAGDCESCHGPRSKHVEDPSEGRRFQNLTAREQSAICLQCHEGGSRMGWRSGVHQTADVSCSSCHMVMERKSDKALLIHEDTTAACYTCHADVRSKMHRTSHHPVREGRMDCASCHDVHGSTSQALLRGNTINETCYSCHAEKRGPFIWEHAPVRENCLNCHDAHGSNNRNMLVTKDPFLCLQCHSYGGHINLPRYNRVSNPYGSGCVNCHVATHGSNHPSGAKQTR
jgi:DmsE family decaheme c-type cytochrome